MARRTQEQAQATRQGILDAAVQVFLERGFQRSSMQHVADRACVTRGAVYWHFRDQADLLEALLDQTPLPWQVLTPLPEPLADDAPAAWRRDALTQMAVVPLHWLEGSEPAQRVLRIVAQLDALGSSTWLGVRLAGIRHAALQRLQIALRQAAASHPPGPRAADVPLAALGVFAVVDGLMHQWLKQPSAFGLTAVGTLAVQSLLDGLLEL